MTSSKEYIEECDRVDPPDRPAITPEQREYLGEQVAKLYEEASELVAYRRLDNCRLSGKSIDFLDGENGC